MNQLGLAINTNMALHAKVPFVAFLRLVHLRVALALFVFGRGWRINDSRIHNRASTDLETVLLKIFVDQREQLTNPGCVPPANDGTCTPSFHPAPASRPRCNANKAAHGARIVADASSTAGNSDQFVFSKVLM